MYRIPEAEKAIIAENLPKNLDWEKVTYQHIGSFGQVFYAGELAGYILKDPELLWKPKGLWK